LWRRRMCILFEEQESSWWPGTKKGWEVPCIIKAVKLGSEVYQLGDVVEVRVEW